VVALLDVNALIALFWSSHNFHPRMQGWFAANSGSGWATCAFTEAGFVRVVSNPMFSPRAVSPVEAIELLEGAVQHAGHRFWEDEVSVADATRSIRAHLIGHQQVTDAYLLGLAIHKEGKLVTFDRSIAALVPGHGGGASYLEIIR